jgi:hypothetical protein
LPSDLSLLLCGKPTALSSGSELGEILAHIKESMDYLMDQLSWLGEQDVRHISMLGPFFGRSLLELATTALIGRLDPLRLLVVRKIQAQGNYKTGIPWKASIRWTGDVIAEKKAPNPWSETMDYKEMSRALLGEYYDHLLWRPAAQQMLGAVTDQGVWLAELAANDMELFISRKRDEIGRLYSSLSKGIHHEFVMPPGTLYDRSTVRNLVLSTVRQVAELGLVSHFIAHASATLNSEEALATFNRIENVEVMK